MKTLQFSHAGKDYAVSLEPATFGHITRYGEHTFALPHPQWRIVGFSRHHWANYAHFPTAESIAKDPAQLNGALVWDKDHGTLRKWLGRYCGKLPRVRGACVTG